MKISSKRYCGFTLIELLYVTLIIGFLMPSMVAIYSFIIRANRDIAARETSIQQGYEIFERLNILMQDYTIDYEEYFNRQRVGCVGSSNIGKNFKWNIGMSGYCTNFTAYGNENSTNRSTLAITLPSKYHDIYYCSSKGSQQGKGGLELVVNESDCGTVGSRQSFGQYKNLFVDVGSCDGSQNCVGDNDDGELGYLLNTGVNAIVDSDNIQELYLISYDGKSRLYFRRKVVPSSNTGFLQYRIQMLRLRGFDAGREHNFDRLSVGMYDGKIDTWACDASMGFEPKQSHKTSSNTVGGAYGEYYLPLDEDDCWIDLTYGSTTVSMWNLSISPLGDPDLYWAEPSRQINPFIKILVVNGVYLPQYSYQNGVGSSINDFKVPIETTINTRGFYFN